MVAEIQHDLGRDLTEADLAVLVPVLDAPSALATFVLFSDGAHDYSCFAYPDSYSPTGFGLVTAATPDHAPNRLDATQLVVIVGSGYTSEVDFAGWLWGVAPPEIAGLTLTSREGATGTIGEVGHTVLRDGYFFSVFYGPCCVGDYVTISGFDGSGSEVFRSPAG